MIQDKQEYEVELFVSSRHLIKTYSRNPEEAESDAEALFEDGDTGERLSYSIDQVDAYPLDDIDEEDDEDKILLEDLIGD